MTAAVLPLHREAFRADVKRTLADPRKLCEALGLVEGSTRQAKGLSIRCPAHAERNPSCSVTAGDDGTVRV